MWSKVSYYSVEVRGKSKRREKYKRNGELYHPPNSLTSIHIYRELSEHKTAISVSVELIQLHLVHFGAKKHLTLQI